MVVVSIVLHECVDGGRGHEAAVAVLAWVRACTQAEVACVVGPVVQSAIVLVVVGAGFLYHARR